MIKQLGMLVLMSLLVVACAADTTYLTATTTSINIERTETLLPTKTSEPTATIVVVTSTELPTRTSEPTATATMFMPTLTAELPTRTPAPVEMTIEPLPTKVPIVVTPTPSFSSLSSLVDMADGTKVTIMGDVVHTESFSKGFKLTLADETGRVVLLLWQDTYDAFVQRPLLNIGSSVRVEGRVSRFESVLQVTPWNADSIQLRKEAYPWAQPASISQLASKLNQRVMIDGHVVRATRNQYGTKIVMKDEAAEVEVFVWQNIFDRMPNQAALQLSGTAIRVIGRVDEYRGNYQLLPALPYDIVVR